MSCAGADLTLTRKERLVLAVLRQAEGCSARREALMDALYPNPDDAPYGKILDVWICKLRKKLRDAGVPGEIHTLWSRGWQINDEMRAALDERLGRIAAASATDPTHALAAGAAA